MALPALSPAVWTWSARAGIGILVLLTLPVCVQLGNHHICRVADDCTCDAGNVSTQEANARLGNRAITLLWFPQLLVDELDRFFKRGELAHGVGNLPPPQRHDSFVQSGKALLSRDLAPALAHRVGKRRQ